jgi:hypothetical protein
MTKDDEMQNQIQGFCKMFNMQGFYKIWALESVAWVATILLKVHHRREYGEEYSTNQGKMC